MKKIYIILSVRRASFVVTKQSLRADRLSVQARAGKFGIVLSIVSVSYQRLCSLQYNSRCSVPLPPHPSAVVIIVGPESQ